MFASSSFLLISSRSSWFSPLELDGNAMLEASDGNSAASLGPLRLLDSSLSVRSNLGGGDLTPTEAKEAWTDMFLPPGQADYDTFWNGGSARLF